MKLLMCPHCSDLFNLVLGREKVCSCGKTRGKYVDQLNAIHSGDGMLLGINSPQFINALRLMKFDNKSTDFTAFTIHNDCKTFVKKDT